MLFIRFTALEGDIYRCHPLINVYKTVSEISPSVSFNNLKVLTLWWWFKTWLKNATLIIPVSLCSPHHLPTHHLLVHIHRGVLPWVRWDPLAHDVRTDGPGNEVNIQLDSQRRQLDNGLHCHSLLCRRGQQFGQGLDVLGVRCFQFDTGKLIHRQLY